MSTGGASPPRLLQNMISPPPPSKSASMEASCKKKIFCVEKFYLCILVVPKNDLLQPIEGSNQILKKVKMSPTAIQLSLRTGLFHVFFNQTFLFRRGVLLRAVMCFILNIIINLFMKYIKI